MSMSASLLASDSRLCLSRCLWDRKAATGTVDSNITFLSLVVIYSCLSVSFATYKEKSWKHYRAEGFFLLWLCCLNTINSNSVFINTWQSTLCTSVTKICMYVCMYVCMWVVWKYAIEMQKRMSNAPELDLQVVVSHHIQAGSWSQFL
jgi:Ca2+/Na+ antiporter